MKKKATLLALNKKSISKFQNEAALGGAYYTNELVTSFRYCKSKCCTQGNTCCGSTYH
ncbi:hypothetical protein [Kordia jejudonensis]|uniref:hypothetical protein n=1 Tax=Kordia jejudonensis TaxID=1348245 RepID=UPI0012E0BEC2|nr:hypothetical protein [Kordia jejudonensis]